MSHIQELKRTFTGTGSDDTPEGAIIRAGCKHATKTITLSANGTSASVNVFQLTGTCEVTGLHGIVLTATTLTNCTSVYFDLWDGTLSVPITKTTGTAFSGFGVGSFFVKSADVLSSLSTLQNNQARILEAATGVKVNADLYVIQKISTNTYIRFNYTTTDAPINATVKVGITFADIDSGTIVAV